MNYSTQIDRVRLQIDVTCASRQFEITRDLFNLINSLESFYIKKRKYGAHLGNIYEYFIYYKSQSIASIKTGSHFIKNGHMSIVAYYIKIELAGIKRYKNDGYIDDLSEDFLFNICGYLNKNRVDFKLTGLDICIDSLCDFNNILALCISRSPKTDYYDIDEKQLYTNTTYIEKIDKNSAYRSVKRAYLYSKTSKEKLGYSLTRFELKLQSRYFNTNGLNLEHIEKTFNKYCIMYFESMKDKQRVIEAYKKSNFNSKDIYRLGFDRYRLYLDMGYIRGFINALFSCIKCSVA